MLLLGREGCWPCPPCAAEPPAVRAAAGALPPAAAPRGRVCPSQHLSGEEMAPAKEGSPCPRGRGFISLPTPTPQGRKTSGSTTKCCCGGNEFPVQRQGRGGRLGQALLGSHGVERGWRVQGHGLRAAFARCPLATELGLAHFVVPLFGKDVNFTEEKLFPGEKLFPRQVSRCLLRQVRSSPELLPPAA